MQPSSLSTKYNSDTGERGVWSGGAVVSPGEYCNFALLPPPPRPSVQPEHYRIATNATFKCRKTIRNGAEKEPTKKQYIIYDINNAEKIGSLERRGKVRKM